MRSEVKSMDDIGSALETVLHLVTSVIQLVTAIIMYKVAKKNRRK